MAATADPARVVVGPNRLEGLLGIPDHPVGLIIFAHGSGSGRLSPRNQYVAQRLRAAGFATLLLDLLTPEEEQDRRNVFDIPMLASRLVEAAQWAAGNAKIATLPVGYFGASTGGGAALVAAAAHPDLVRAVVSRGGRPDLAGDALGKVKAPTLLLVGGNDEAVEELNCDAMQQMNCTVDLHIVPGAGHLFEEPGTLDDVVAKAIGWFRQYARARPAQPAPTLPFANRTAAGKLLAQRLEHLRGDHPLVLALPRGGVPVAYEVAEHLDADLDLLLVRKIGAPGHAEYGIGAIVDGHPPQAFVNQASVRTLGIASDYLEREIAEQTAELERRRKQYLAGREPVPVKGRTVIVVDDGIATGGTVTVALRALRDRDPNELVLAIPVAPAESIGALQEECDELICLAVPEPFYAVGAHYRDFSQTTDREVNALLEAHDQRLAAPA